MPPKINFYTLKEKKTLAPDVYEMVFEAKDEIEVIPWQFITFFLPQTNFARSYSVLKQEGRNIYFIIKMLELGRWWSKELCGYEPWVELRWIGPAGRFIDTHQKTNKLYLATGTGIVPIYFLLKEYLWWLEWQKVTLLFGNRNFEESYYLDKFQEFSQKYPHFDYKFYLSREEKEGFEKWYISQFLTQENISSYDEFYICWNPLMVDDVIEKLEAYNVDEANIFHEKY